MNKKLVGFLAVVLLVILAVVGWLAGPADAHDAPPHGSATCQTTGADATWQVLNGSAVTENTGGEAVHVNISSTAGTVTQNQRNVTGDGQTITFTITDIPISVGSVTVNAKTTWNGGGIDNHSVVIGAPSNNCEGTVDIPEAPLPNGPSCTVAGSVNLPANSGVLKWTAGPGPDDVSVHIAGGSNVTFPDGSTHKTFTEVVLPELTGVACTERITPPTLTPIPATCDTAGSLVIPANTDKVKWLVDGQQLNGGSGGTLGVGTYQISAHTTIDYLFVGDIREVDFNEGVQAQLTGDQCSTNSTPPPSSTPPSSPASTPVSTPPADSTPPASTSPAPTPVVTSSPIPKTSLSIGTGVVVHKKKLAAKHQPLASTGSETGQLLAIGFGGLLLGFLLLGAGVRGSRKH